MTDIKFDRDTVLHDLRENVMIITYTNEQGHKRDVKCTLMEHLFPPNVKHNLAADLAFHGKERNAKLMVVFDMENLGYRTLHMDRIQWVEARDAIQYK